MLVVTKPEHRAAVPPMAAVWSDDLVTLYRAHYRAMVRLAFLLTGSSGQAEEIVQDAFIRMRAHHDVAEPASYLRSVVVNASRDVLRRRALQDRVKPRLLLGDGTTVDAVDELADALGRLPHRQRAVLVLRYYQGLSESEIAVALGCRPGTVKSLAHRGLAALREVLEP